MYIRSAGNISPQKTFGNIPFLAEPVAYTGNRLNCIEPDYKSFIDPKLIRRMSRIIKMGVAAAKECLHQAGVELPDAIVTGTAYGCLEDTGIFLTRMVEQNEELLAPTAFIQSTHNTVGAQIALMLHCNGYNNVFVHRAFSFENALLDAMLLIKENEAQNVLVGGVDEITNISHTILSRLGLYKKTPVENLRLYNERSGGTINGEGANFFLVDKERSTDDYCKLDALITFYKPNGIDESKQQIESFLQAQSLQKDDVDLIITGKNGDAGNDQLYDDILTDFNTTPAINYKNLCGEYPTANAFGLWVGANILKTGEVPAVFNYNNSTGKKINRILIYNNSRNIHHSLLLISAC